MKNERTVNFKVRAYGRTELALEYLPDLQPNSAYRRLKQWIEVNPVLKEKLLNNGTRSKLRCWTPAEVALIVDVLGEP